MCIGLLLLFFKRKKRHGFCIKLVYNHMQYPQQSCWSGCLLQVFCAVRLIQWWGSTKVLEWKLHANPESAITAGSATGNPTRELHLGFLFQQDYYKNNIQIANISWSRRQFFQLLIFFSIVEKDSHYIPYLPVYCCQICLIAIWEGNVYTGIWNYPKNADVVIFSYLSWDTKNLPSIYPVKPNILHIFLLITDNCQTEFLSDWGNSSYKKFYWYQYFTPMVD